MHIKAFLPSIAEKIDDKYVSVHPFPILYLVTVGIYMAAYKIITYV